MGLTAVPDRADELLRLAVLVPGQWTFWADTMNREPLGNVDVTSFYCVSRLSAFGYGNVTVSLPCGITSDRLLRLWSWRLWAFYDGEPYWCGVPSGLADEDGRTTCQLTLTELPGYLAKRVWDYHPDRRFTQVDQCEIARVLAEPLADVGVATIVQRDVELLRDRTYEYLESDHRAQLLVNLAGVLDGPEFRSEYAMAEGRPECRWRVGFPRIGSDEPGLGVTVPGAAVGYRAAWDSDQLRTRTFACGDLPENAPEGTPRPVVVEDRPQADLPRLDAVDNWPGTVLVSTLRERAETAATRQAAPALALAATPPEHLPPVTSYGPGDTVTLRAETPLIPGGLDVTGRLSQIEVNAAEGTAVWTITTSQPPPVARSTLNGRLDQLDTTLARVFRSGRLQPQETP